MAKSVVGHQSFIVHAGDKLNDDPGDLRFTMIEHSPSPPKAIKLSSLEEESNLGGRHMDVRNDGKRSILYAVKDAPALVNKLKACAIPPASS